MMSPLVKFEIFRDNLPFYLSRYSRLCDRVSDIGGVQVGRETYFISLILSANFVFSREKYVDIASQIHVDEPKTNGADDET